MELICIDTPILFYAIKGQDGGLHPQEIVDRTRRFINKIRLDGVNIMVPSVVYGEFLSSFPPELYSTLDSLMQMSFYIASYDYKTAIKFGELKDKKYDIIKSYQKSEQYSPGKILVDCQIIATAMSHEAKYLLSEEETIHRLAANLVPTKRIPNIPEQLNLSNILA